MSPQFRWSSKNAIQIDQNANVTFTDGAITASNDISSSGNVLASSVFINGENALRESGGKGFVFDDAQITELQIGKQATVTKTTISGDIEAVGHITASGNISSSGDIFVGDDLYIGGSNPKSSIYFNEGGTFTQNIQRDFVKGHLELIQV